jgi:hypothetical protein
MRVPNSSSITGRATHAINANGTVAGSDRSAAPAGSALNLLKSAFDSVSAILVPADEQRVTFCTSTRHPSPAAISPIAFTTVVDSRHVLL